ncbi:oxidoreductase [soil metagenome]
MRPLSFAVPALVLHAIARPVAAQWTAQSSGTAVELRGLSAVSPSVAWGSGQNGTVIRTTDGGRTWTAGTVADASTLDLRGIAAISARTAFAMSIGDSSRIFRTTDGGRTWSLRFVSTRKGSFLDAIRFWDARHGIAVSDPVDGKFLIVTTSDGGETWQETPAAGMPPALPNEGAFAASGSCLAVRGHGDAWFVTGGASVARVFYSTDFGMHWVAYESPIRAGSASEGIFSVAFRDAKHGVISGGDYRQTALGGRNVALTSDGGRSWTLVDSASSPQGFMSAVAFVPGTNGRELVAVGLNGTDRSRDGGLTWTATDSTPYNSLQFGGRTGFVVGPSGRAATAVFTIHNAHRR